MFLFKSIGEEFMLRIITDSASDILWDESRKLNIDIVPLSITFEDGPCPQEKYEDYHEFYRRLEVCDKLPVTSQPAPAKFLELFKKYQDIGDPILVITMSSGISGTISAAQTAKEMIDYDQITIFDSQQAILSQRMLVNYAVQLRDEGKNVEEIVEKLDIAKDKITIIGLLDTLTYLKKGGRIPKSIANIGDALKIKPIIILEDGVLKSLKKKRGRKAGISALLEVYDERKAEGDYPVYFGYTSNRKLGKEFKKIASTKYQLQRTNLFPVGGIIGTHCGTNCIAICFINNN